MYTTCSELVVFMYYLTGKSMNNLLSYCGLVDARISASEKDLPVNVLYFDESVKLRSKLQRGCLIRARFSALMGI